MKQRELLSETEEFIRPTERKVTGIKFHEKYSQSILFILLSIVAILFIYWLFFGQMLFIAFGVILFVIGIFSEIILRKMYGFTGQDAVKYYALELYKNPDQLALNQLHSWNKNPFDLSTEYYYPRIGRLVEEARQTDEPEEYIHKHISDELRLIEQLENESHQSLVNLELDEVQLDEYYQDLVAEINYCYKFGAYTSVSVLLRKLTEQLLVDILIGKGLYTELSTEYGFEELISVFISEVVQPNYPEEIATELEKSLDIWIRKKGNKGAHKPEQFTKEEIEQLMKYGRKTIRLLVVIRSETHPDYTTQEVNDLIE